MTDSENYYKEEIRKYLEEGYTPEIIPEILIFEKLIEFWSIKGRSIVSYNDIQFVLKLVPNPDKSSFTVTKTKHSSSEIPAKVSDIVKYLQNTEVDDSAFIIYEEQDEKNSLTLLTDLLKEYQGRLGNQLAGDVFNSHVYSIYNDTNNQREDDLTSLYRDIIQLRYMEGYSSDVIKNTLIFKVCLMEWSDKGWSLINESDVDIFYSEMRDAVSEFIPKLTPRNSEDAKILTDNLIKDLENLDFTELEQFKLQSLNKKNAASVLVSIIIAYRNKIGGKLMEETFTSLLMEMVTKTSNYNDKNK